MFRRPATGRWRPGHCTCWDWPSSRHGPDRRGASATSSTPIRHFHAAGDVAGLTLTLDDLSSIAVADGDLERAARLRGGARATSSNETGASSAIFDRGHLRDARTRPSVRTQMSADDLERLGAEGAAMTLDEAVAYALEGTAPEDDEA